MRGYIEIKEDAYDDTIEHLHRLKSIACKMIKKLSESSDIYDYKDRDYEEDDNEELETRNHGTHKTRGRYGY